MKAIVIDDELLPGRFLVEMLQKHCFEITEITHFTSANKAISHLQNFNYDIVFLDIEMPEMNSFDFLKKAMLSNKTKIIFVTAYSKYALKAFDVEATHYLLKPVARKELVDAVRRVFKIKNNKPSSKNEDTSKISIFDGKSYVVVKAKEIVRMQADGSYTKIILTNGSKLMASKRLGHFEEILHPDIFFRCHKSHLINLNKVYSFNKGKAGCITLTNKDEVPISLINFQKIKGLLGIEGK